MRTIRGQRKACERQIVSLLQDMVNDVLTKKDNVVFGLIGGRSVATIYKLLLHTAIPFKKIHFFMVDERAVPLDSEESNYKQAYDALLRDLKSRGVPEGNFHPYKVEEGVEKYSKEFLAIQDHFDIVLLSAGEDAHVASLFPEHDVLNEDTPGFVQIEDSPKPPSIRITATVPTLSKTDKAILVMFGEGKKEALEKYLDDDTYIDNCPAKIVDLAKESYVFTDVME